MATTAVDATDATKTNASLATCCNAATPQPSLEQLLFRALRDNGVRSPSSKEFDESYAFVNAVRSSLFRSNKKKKKKQQERRQQHHNNNTSTPDADTTFTSSYDNNNNGSNIQPGTYNSHNQPLEPPRQQEPQLDLVIDVAGGHGAVAALFLILTSAREACVIDPARVGKGGVAKAWSPFYNKDNNNKDRKVLRYRHECLRIGLPQELEHALTMNTHRSRSMPMDDDERRRRRTTNANVLVVACHACQHLSEEVLQIAHQYGVHCAVLPCCQTDLSPGAPWKATAKNLQIPFATVMDLLLAGKAQSLVTTTRATTRSTTLGNVSFLSPPTAPLIPPLSQPKPPDDNHVDWTRKEQEEELNHQQRKHTREPLPWHASYQVRMKVMDPKITPQNRIIVCRSLVTIDRRDHHRDPDDDSTLVVVGGGAAAVSNTTNKQSGLFDFHRNAAQMEAVNKAHQRLERAYHKAHRHAKPAPIVKEGTSPASTINSSTATTTTSTTMRETQDYQHGRPSTVRNMRNGSIRDEKKNDDQNFQGDKDNDTHNDDDHNTDEAMSSTTDKEKSSAASNNHRARDLFQGFVLGVLVAIWILRR